MSKFGRILKHGAAYLLGAVIMLTAAACNMPTSSTAVPINTSVPKIRDLPELTSAVVENKCNIRINYIDHVKNPDMMIVLDRMVNKKNMLWEIQWKAAQGEKPASFLDEGLPGGEYTYMVHYSDHGGWYSPNPSETIVLDAATCGSGPVGDIPAPFSPVITKVEVVGTPFCTVQISSYFHLHYEKGVRIYRSTSGAEYEKIADFSVEDWVSRLPLTFDDPSHRIGTYDDTDLQKGTYRYKMSAYNETGETFSEPSAEVLVPEKGCNPKLDSLPTVASLDVVTSTPTLVPAPEPKACIWEAAINVFVRTGPGASLYPDITGVVAGTQFPIVGQSEDGQFWVVAVKPGLNGYVPKAEKFSRTSGDCGNPPTLQDPPAPPTVTPTTKPHEVPQCNDGIDNDGDGGIDMRDRQCTNLDDNSEN